MADQELIQIKAVFVNKQFAGIIYRQRVVHDEIFEINGKDKRLQLLTENWSDWCEAQVAIAEKMNGVLR